MNQSSPLKKLSVGQKVARYYRDQLEEAIDRGEKYFALSFSQLLENLGETTQDVAGLKKKANSIYYNLEIEGMTAIRLSKNFFIRYKEQIPNGLTSIEKCIAGPSNGGTFGFLVAFDITASRAVELWAVTPTKQRKTMLGKDKAQVERILRQAGEAALIAWKEDKLLVWAEVMHRPQSKHSNKVVAFDKHRHKTKDVA